MKQCKEKCPLRVECFEIRANDEYAARQAIAAEVYLEAHPKANPNSRRTRRRIGKLALGVDPMGTFLDILDEHGTEEDETLSCPGPQKLETDGVRKKICGSPERQARLRDLAAFELGITRLQLTEQPEA